MKDNTLLVSEKFFSCQGEGRSTGVPAYFIRLSQCNLNCGLHMLDVNKYKKDADHQQELIPNLPGASWVCDSIPVWTRGTEISFQSIVDKWKEEGLWPDLKRGIIHIIWTGGEPTLPMHQSAINAFYEYLNANYPSFAGYAEIETNGTNCINDALFDTLDQINCSAKLANSGMRDKQRIVPSAIKRIMEHHNYQFKFVVSTEQDIEEMFETYIHPFNIPLQNVYCMPGMDKQEQFFERTRFVLEMAKKYHFQASARLHIAAWNQVVGC